MKRLVSLVALFSLMTLMLTSRTDASTGTVLVEILPGLAEPSTGNAFAINDCGQIAGVAGAPGTAFATLWQRGHGGKYGVLDLGTLGGAYSFARDINELGEVVGSSFVDAYAERAFLWRNGQMIDLTGAYSVAYAINNRSQIVGYRESRGFLWQDNTLIDLGSLGPPGDERSQAYGMNELGHIVGWSITGLGESGAVIWKDGEIFALGNYTTEAFDINEHDQIVGMWGGPTGNGSFLLHDGNMTTLGGENSVATAVNDLGQVVGYRNVYPEGGEPYSEAFLWEDGVERILPLPVGARGGLAHSINNCGQIVGDIITQDWFSQPVLWTIKSLGSQNQQEPCRRGRQVCQGSGR